MQADVAAPFQPPLAAAARPAPGALARAVAGWHADTDSVWAWENYRASIVGLARDLHLRRLCEIGGGRDPLFTPADVGTLDFELVVNDIDPAELALGPGGFETACFDISGDVSAELARGRPYDMMFSRMVFEHVADGGRAWRNVHALLSPGGVGLAFVPTLYAWPFLLNHLLPDGLSGRILRALFPGRADQGDDPKFPTHYSWTFGSQARLEPKLRALGFSEVAVVPFWGHGYLGRIPVLRELDAAFTRLCVRADWRLLTTYAYIIARK